MLYISLSGTFPVFAIRSKIGRTLTADFSIFAESPLGGLHDFKETRLKLVTLNDPQELFSTLDNIAERWGEEEAPTAGNIYGL